MKKLITLITFILLSVAGFSQQSTLPTGAVPYGSQYYKAPDGSVWMGATGKQFTRVTEKRMLDSLATAFNASLALKENTDNKVTVLTTPTNTTFPTTLAVTTALALKANLASPPLTGVPTAPTATAGTSTTQLATTQFVSTAVAAATIPDATTAVKGKVKLAGDLSGTADLPTVPALLEKVDKVPGKGLSAEDYTTVEKAKLAGIATGAEVNVNADWSAVSGDAQILNKPATASNLAIGARTSTTLPISNDNGTGATLPIATTTLAGLESAADKTKLDGIATGATANQTDAYLLARANHTGVQAISTVTGLQTALDDKIPLTQKAANNGVATLDASGKVPASQLPVGSQVYKGTWDASTNTPTLADGTGTAGWTYRVTVGGTRNLGSGNIVFSAGDDVIYNGTIWQRIPNASAVASVNGQTGAVVLTKSDVALGNVDNTSDLNKPVSTANQTALNLKENTANKSTSTSLGTSDVLFPTQNAVKTYTDAAIAANTGASNLSVGTRTSTTLPVANSNGTGVTLPVASTTLAGLQSAADKSKLDGIATGATANVGTVTSVGLSVPTGMTVIGTPVTGAGTLSLGYAAGYSIPTTAKQGNWDTAFGWGDHAGLYAPIAHVGSGGAAHAAATTSVAGFLSATDKTKLDAITGTNTGDQSLVLGSTAGNVQLNTGSSVTLSSVGVFNKTDASTLVPSAGLWIHTNTTGSVDFPAVTGGGITYSRNGAASALSGFQIWKNQANDGNTLYFRSGISATTFSPWEKFASQEWTTTNFAPISGGGSFILNQTTQQATSAFNISGNGVIGGRIGIAVSPSPNVGIHNNYSMTGSTTGYGVLTQSTISSGVTNVAFGYRSVLSTEAAAFTVGSVQHFAASQGSVGAGSNMADVSGFVAESSLAGTTRTSGFLGVIPAGANKYNVNAVGTAQNYFAGNVGINVTAPTEKLDVAGNGKFAGDLTMAKASPLLNFIGTDAIGSIGKLTFNISTNERASIDAYRHTAVGQLTDLIFSTMGTERMRISNGGITTLSGALNGASAVFSGNVSTTVAPTLAGHLTNKAYVDTQDALNVSKIGDVMTGPLVMSPTANVVSSLSSLQQVISNPTSYYADAIAGTTTGAIIIKHATLSSATMFDVKLKIYQYTTGATTEARVSFYKAASASIITTGRSGYIVSSLNTPTLNNIQAGFNTAGEMVLILGDISTVWGTYTRVVVEDIVTSFTGGNDASWRDGWSTEIATSLAGYTSLIDIPFQNIFNKPTGNTTQYVRGDGSIATLPVTTSDLGLGTRTTTTMPITNSNGTGVSLPVATTTLAGLQSSADKTKLDGIAAGATANTGTVTSVVAGNGMANGTITTTGSVTLGTPSDVTLSSTNNVSATSHSHNFAPGGTAAQYITGAATLVAFPTNIATATTLQTARTIWGQSFNGSANISGALTGVTTITASSSATFGGSVTAVGGFFDTSDIRLKNVVNTKFDASGIKAISYRWKNKSENKTHVGYSAQQVQKFMPDAVNTANDGTLSVNYIEVLVNKVEALEKKIQELERRLK